MTTTLQSLIHEAREALSETDALGEAVPRRIKRRQAGKGRRKMTKVCPTGHHMQGGRCVKVPQSKLARTARKKSRRSKTGAGKRTARRSARFKKRFG
jgi:hypothetical protein